MSNEQAEALEQALFLLDTFAGEGIGHVYGNGQELDASDVCTELAEAFDVHCEPGWHRVLAARLATPSPAPSDTLERREAMKAVVRERGGRWIDEDDAEYIVEGILALSLPAREVSGERGLTYAAFQQRRGRLPDLIEEALSIYDEFMKDDAYDAQRPLDKIAELLRSARDFYDVTLATTPAPREKLEAVIEPARQLLNVALMTTFSDQYPQQCHDLSEALNRLSGEG